MDAGLVDLFQKIFDIKPSNLIDSVTKFIFLTQEVLKYNGEEFFIPTILTFSDTIFNLISLIFTQYLNENHVFAIFYLMLIKFISLKQSIPFEIIFTLISSLPDINDDFLFTEIIKTVGILQLENKDVCISIINIIISTINIEKMNTDIKYQIFKVFFNYAIKYSVPLKEFIQFNTLISVNSFY